MAWRGLTTQRAGRPLRRLVRRFVAHDGGATAVEFGIVALPFVMLIFGIIAVALYYFQISSMENAAWQAARAIRTGQMQNQSGSYSAATTDSAKRTVLKNVFCASAPALSNCASNLVVIVQSSTAFSGISAPSCSLAGTMLTDAQTGFSPGASSSVVMVTFCYAWAMGGKLPFFKLGNLSNGNFLMQASVAFRTEPY